MEELVPPDYLISPTQFESVFVNRQNYTSLRSLALEGHLGSVRNRFTAWKLLLNLLPGEGSPDDWVARTHELRAEYKALQDSLKVRVYSGNYFCGLGPCDVQPTVACLRRTN